MKYAINFETIQIFQIKYNNENLITIVISQYLPTNNVMRVEEEEEE